MQIGSDARAHTLQFQQTTDAVLVKRCTCSHCKERCQSDKPPALPDWPQDSERDECRLRAGDTVHVDGAYLETIRTRRETRVSDRTLLSLRTPIAVCAV